MTSSERRKIMCSVTFHVIAITCVVWSLYVLIDRTAEEISQLIYHLQVMMLDRKLELEDVYKYL